MSLEESAFSAAFRDAVGIPQPKWIEWIHVSMGKTHCPTCLRLDKCWFADSKKSPLPQHPFCHCKADPIPFAQVQMEASASSAFSKFDPYLFDPDNYYKHGKNEAFNRWGYYMEDSAWLQKEFEKQALTKYLAGEYTLGKLNENGQRITIRIDLPRKTGSGMVSFQTGWMVYPNGHLQLSTPYGGK